MQANAGMIKLPVAILNHGNTVKFTEYSFLANVFAARGYMAVSIQHDLRDRCADGDQGRRTLCRPLPQYQRGVANIMFAVDEMKKIQPNADYDHLTMVGHSNGGDISMYFAKMYPDQIKKVVTLDNLRVPFMTDGKFKILSFRSKDPVFKADPGVVPDDDICEKAGITVVKTGYQHTDMSDRGPDEVKSTIQGMLDKFLGSTTASSRRCTTKAPKILTEPGPGRAVRAGHELTPASPTAKRRLGVSLEAFTRRSRIDRTGVQLHIRLAAICEPYVPRTDQTEIRWRRTPAQKPASGKAGRCRRRSRRRRKTSPPSSPRRARCRRMRPARRAGWCSRSTPP